MSAKERKRLVILAEVRKKRMSLAQAGRVMGMSYRQAKRIWGRYLKKGDAGLVHGLRGKPGPRAKATAVRRRILARFKERYADFGPNLGRRAFAEGWLDGGSRDLAALADQSGSGSRAGRAASIGPGGSGGNVLARWCSWMARSTTGLKGGAGARC
jgi:molybdenum-dependent DNA-binding transcriptional regulator ModE